MQGLHEIGEHPMRPVPLAVRARFITWLEQKSIPCSIHFHCIKWLRYYLNFHEKYRFPQAQSGSRAPSLQKLQDKKQAPSLQQQARNAISPCCVLLQSHHPETLARSPQRRITAEIRNVCTSPRATAAVAKVPASTASRLARQNRQALKRTPSIIAPGAAARAKHGFMDGPGCDRLSNGGMREPSTAKARNTLRSTRTGRRQ